MWCFFFNDTATTEIYTLSLHDALPISECQAVGDRIGERNHDDRQEGRYSDGRVRPVDFRERTHHQRPDQDRSEEHTSELQSPCNLVCRLLLEKTQLTAGSTPA